MVNPILRVPPVIRTARSTMLMSLLMTTSVQTARAANQPHPRLVSAGPPWRGAFGHWVWGLSGDLSPADHLWPNGSRKPPWRCVPHGIW